MKPKNTENEKRLAQDMQLAFALQAKESRKARHRQMKRSAREDTNNNALQDGFDFGKVNADHMVFVSCILDGGEVNLLVDSGASCSAMSIDMVKFLGLEGKMNRAVYGDAKGIGTSSIIGIVKNVELLVGHVEFRLFFMVIDSKLPCCILGLDQMRRFKCLIDLDENVLTFGGKNGVSVPFLSRKEASTVTRQMICCCNLVPTTNPDHRNSSINIGGIGNKIKSLFKS
mmetsp:Transcript_40973/g.41637  ORF Transcript_40973/g.41637 Transcript_40973/m.41637 type:complete len:228 (-) Transcript_40973:1175-1858(-)